MPRTEVQKATLIVFAMLRSVGVFTMATYGAVIIALVSGLPSLAPGSWQSQFYPEFFGLLASGFFPALIAMVLLGLGTAAADEVLVDYISRSRGWVWGWFVLYFVIVCLLLVRSQYVIVTGFSSLHGYMTASIEQEQKRSIRRSDLMNDKAI